MKRISTMATMLAAVALVFTRCSDEKDAGANTDDVKPVAAQYGGFDSQVKWGERLVFVGGCNDCHTPKKMGPNGPEGNDMSLMLSGHPANMPAAPFDAKDAAKKGLVVTQTFTAWTGPWGTTYAANLTSDSTGIGTWKEEQFLKALKEKKWMGLDNTRPLMPPMSMMPVTEMTEDEIKAIFAYLKTTPPIKNVIPEAVLLPAPAPAK